MTDVVCRPSASACLRYEALSHPVGAQCLACVVAGRSTALAVQLAQRGARFVVVGGTAGWLRDGARDESPSPRDLDVVVTGQQISTLVFALGQICVQITPATLQRCREVAVDTAWGPLDVFVAENLPAASTVCVGGCALEVADD